MKRFKRLLSLLLSFCLFLSVPGQAFAALTENSEDYNEEILEALADVVGSEEEAKKYYGIMEGYGLLDEDGNFVTNLKATIDGKEYDLEALCELLSGDFDGEKLAYVDGMPITLNNLWNIIVIEGYLDYLREKYYINGEWTQAHEDSFADFKAQLAAGNFKLNLATDPSMEGDYSGMNHGAYLSFEAQAAEGEKITVHVTLNAAKAGQKASFYYETVSGSTRVEALREYMSLTADENGKASGDITVTLIPETSDSLLSEGPLWYLSVHGLEGARFDETRSTAATLAFSGLPTAGKGTDIDRLTGSFNRGFSLTALSANGIVFVPLGLSSGERLALSRGFINMVTEFELSSGAMVFSSEDINRTQTKVYYTLKNSNGDTILDNTLLLYLKESPYIDNEGMYTVKKVEKGEDYQANASLEGLVTDGNLQYQMSADIHDVPGTFKFYDTIRPDFTRIYTAKADYLLGQAIPIVVEFSEPMNPSSCYLTVNGLRVKAQETAASNRLSFAYPVQPGDSAHPYVSKVEGEDLSGNTLVAHMPNPDSEAGLCLEDALTDAASPISAIADITAEIDDSNPLLPILTVTLKLSENSDLVAWLGSDVDEHGVSSRLAAATSAYGVEPFVLQGESFAGGEMKASFYLEPVPEDKSFTVELYLDDSLVFGSLKRLTQKALVLVKPEDLSVGLITAAGELPEAGEAGFPVLYVQDEPGLRALFSLKEGSFAYGDTASVTTLKEDGTPLDPGADFAWSSSDPSVAQIGPDGRVTPSGKNGTVSFILTALNGNQPEKYAAVCTETVQFSVGLTPFLLIPNNQLESSAGQPVSLFWSSNLPDKDPGIVFTVTLENAEGKELSRTSVKGECGTVLPASLFSYQYGSAANRFTITVSAEYDGTLYSAEAALSLTPAPAIVSMDPLDSYYMTDKVKSLDLSWIIFRFDLFDGEDSALFRLLVTRNEETVLSSQLPGNGMNGTYRGSVTLPIADVVTSKDDPSSYRDVYTVTVQAKNGYDSTWSYDSYVFYVYDENALKIWVNGSEADSVTLSNVPAISSMTQDQILALKRDISLKNIISANYGDFAWTDLSDRLVWSSSDDSIADIQYRQGSYYAGIRNYSYVNYRPATEFQLAGISNGEAIISLLHSYTGIGAELPVKVETLKNKLYLFSVTPAVKATAYYQNGKGESCTAESSDNGEFAIFEESGIASDVYFTSELDGIPYYGTYYYNALASGEVDPALLSLYPCNNLELRRAAYAYVYLKNPDGTPYTNSVYLRGGVFLNGEYQEEALFAFKDGQPITTDGTQKTRVKFDEDGLLTIYMDITQWDLENGCLSEKDELRYSFLLQPLQEYDYLPLLVEIDATENQETYVRGGKAVLTVRENTAGYITPFILDEKLVMTNEKEGFSRCEDILDMKSSIGVSQLIPEEDLTISVLWWGHKPDHEFTMDLSVRRAGVKTELPGSYEITTYPYLDDVCVTSYSFHLDHETLSSLGIGPSPMLLHLHYTDVTDDFQRFEDLSFRIADTTDRPLDFNSIEDLIKDMKESSGMTTSKVLGDTSFNDYLVTLFLEYMAEEDYGPDKEHTTGFDLQVTATEDPTVYLAYLATGLGNMKDINVSGIYARESDEYVNYIPGLNEVKLGFGLLFGGGAASRAASGGAGAFDKWLDAYAEEFCDAFDSKLQYEINYLLTGYLECMIYYDLNEESWNIDILSGGFDVGGGANLVKYFNTMVGPVPVTWEVKGGGSVAVNLDVITMQYLNEEGLPTSGNEFLTELRIYIFFRLFGGVGFDFSMIAFKVGLYGQLNLDISARWLNRPALDENDGPLYYPDGTLIPNQDPVQDGRHYRLDGFVGAEAVIKFLFFRYEKSFFSFDYDFVNQKTKGYDPLMETWNTSQKYYSRILQDLIEGGGAEYVTLGDTSVAMLRLAPTMQNFDYLDRAERVWYDSSLSTNPLLGASSGSVKYLQTNANPYSNPVVTDDGSLLVYLSDADGESIHTAYALYNGEGYTDCGFISGLGAGDDHNSAAGTRDFAIAAWTTLPDEQKRDAGSVVTEADQMVMMEGTEVYASLYRNGSWTTFRMSDNSSADLSPVVALSGSRAIVAWRNVASNSLGSNLLEFNTKDTILYRVYDAETGEWSETMSLYNGTSGSIKALNAAMMPDGTAGIVYTLDLDGKDATTSDRELLLATVGPDNEVIRNVRATSDEVADENPQITATLINGEPCFVAAWYASEADKAGNLHYDICMADFSADGVLLGRLPQSLNKITADQELMISSSFRLSRNARSLEELALVWVERLEAEEGEIVTHDRLNSVKFYSYGAENELVGITRPQIIADAPESTLIDAFDCLSEGDKLTAVLLGSFYDPDKQIEKTSETLDGDKVTYKLPLSISSLYTTRAGFGEALSVGRINADFTGLRRGANTQVSFTVTNEGIHTVKSLILTLGSTTAEYEDLNLLPGDSITLFCDYRVPADTVRDEKYVLIGSGDFGSSRVSGMARFGLPDLEITRTGIIKEEDGLRRIEILLNNNSDSLLAGSGRKVTLSFYKDADCTQPFKELEPITVSDDMTLKMIDEGGYSVQIDFNAKAYLATLDGAPTEIPFCGIPVYIRAEVLRDGEIQPDANEASNQARVLCENLELRNERSVSLSANVTRTENGTDITAVLKNNRMAKTDAGNVIVTLYNEDGIIVARKQSYDPAAEGKGLISLSSEERKEILFHFDEEGVYADVEFVDCILEDGSDASLAQLSSTNLLDIVLDAFRAESDDPDSFFYTSATTTEETIALQLSPRNPGSTVTVNGTPVENGYANLPLTEGDNDFDIKVISPDGKQVKHYRLTVPVKSADQPVPSGDSTAVSVYAALAISSLLAAWIALSKKRKNA